MDANKVTFCWPNRIDQATLTMGSWAVTLPLDNLKDRRIKKVARSSDALVTSTKFKIALDSGRDMFAVAIAGHNLSASAQWRVRMYADYDMTVLKWDSAQVDVWPEFFVYEQLEWEDDNFWLGNDTLDNALDYTPLAVLFADQVYTDVRAILVEFFDTANSAGYVQLGRAFIGTGQQPTYNADYGLEFSHETPTVVEEALDGTEYFDRKRARRTMGLTLSYLSSDEAFTNIYAMQRDQGIDKEILIAYETMPSAQFYYRTFLARLRSLKPLTIPVHNRWTAPLEFKEIL